jgi:uncharacterized protein (TIGR03437 family)
MASQVHVLLDDEHSEGPVRLLSIAVLSICAAHAQIYSIQTVAGGGLPENTPCTAADLGLVGGLAADAAGNVYIPVPAYNIVVRCDAATGVLTRVAGTGALGFSDGQNVPATGVRVTSPLAVALNPAGDLYIAEPARVRKVSHGIITTVAGNGIPGFSGDSGPAMDAEVLPGAIAVDASGSVYIAENGRIRKVSNGIITTVANSDQIGTPLGIAVDSAGNLYIVSYIGGGRRRIYEVSNGVITIVPANTTDPRDIAVDGAGNLYISTDSEQIYEFSAGTTSPIASGGAPIAVDAAGNLYYSENYGDPVAAYQPYAPFSGHVRVRKVSHGITTTVAGGAYKTSGDGPATAAQLAAPFGIALDSSGNCYFSESAGNRIRKLSNGVLTTVAGTGTAGFSGDGGPATAAQLSAPAAIALDSQGALYIADWGNNRVRKVLNGVITTVAGNGTAGESGDGGQATSAQLSHPIGLAVDAAGILYISANNRVRKVSNGIIAAEAGGLVAGYLGDNVPATTAQLSIPEGLAVDGSGNLSIADTGNGYVRQVQPNAIIHTIAGIGKTAGDGIRAVDAAVLPRALAVDAAGVVYIGEPASQYAGASGAIRKVTNGLIYAIAGHVKMQEECNCAIDGVGSVLTGNLFGASAVLGTVLGMAVDSGGRIYFVDGDHQTIRVLIPQPSTPVSIAAVRNAASNLQSWIAPGEIVVITGSGLGPADLTMGKLTADGVYDTQIAGASVEINGWPAPLFYASARQVAAVVPYGAIATGPPLLNEITVTYQGSVSNPMKIAGAPLVFGLFTSDGSGIGQAAAVNQDGTLNGASHPAAPGSLISLYATGEGLTWPAGIDGKPATAPLPMPSQTTFALTPTPVAVTVGGQTVTPEYAGGAPGEIAGLMQINVRIPQNITPGNAVPVTVEVQGYSTSQPGVSIVVGK